MGTALVAALGMGMLSVGSVASADESSRDAGGKPDVLGMIVQKASPWVSARSLAATVDRAGGEAVAPVAGGRGAVLEVVEFAEPLTAEEA